MRKLLVPVPTCSRRPDSRVHVMMNNSQGASSFFSGLSTLLGRPHPLLHNLSDTTTSFVETEKSYRRIIGYDQLWMLRAHLDDHEPVAEMRKAG